MCGLGRNDEQAGMELGRKVQQDLGTRGDQLVERHSAQDFKGFGGTFYQVEGRVKPNLIIYNSCVSIICPTSVD
jgi:hypothetical protein